jgi:tetratricopeptide (TPR) repeat protein
VAEAAEGQVDGYLLKPFPIDAFQRKLSEILAVKLNPSPYTLKINEGKSHLQEKLYDQALSEFADAKPLNSKPMLAYFYSGQAWHAKGNLEQALNEFKEGRKFQPLHYKCLIGEFEALMGMKKYPEAYALVEPIRKNYPITSRRLGLMFVASVFTNHFDDLLGFYELFTNLDQRTPELINISSIALLTAGKHFIKQQDLPKALEYLEIGLLISGRDFSYLNRAITELIKAKATAQAEALMGKASPEDIGTPAYRRLSFQVDQMTLPKDQIIEKGRKLIFAGEGNTEIFKSVVQAMAEQGRETLAESVISKAGEFDPQIRPELYKILSAHLPKKN